MGKRAKRAAQEAMSAAWHTAAFHRAKRLPRLQQVIGYDEPKPKSSDEIVKALKAKFGAN